MAHKLTVNQLRDLLKDMPDDSCVSLQAKNGDGSKSLLADLHSVVYDGDDATKTAEDACENDVILVSEDYFE
jgi:hypothetical protein